MSDETNTIIIKDFNGFVNNVCDMNEEMFNKYERASFMAANARTSIMMFKATNDNKYLINARQNIETGKNILQDFTRPFSCIFTKV